MLCCYVWILYLWEDKTPVHPEINLKIKLTFGQQEMNGVNIQDQQHGTDFFIHCYRWTFNLLKIPKLIDGAEEWKKNI